MTDNRSRVRRIMEVELPVLLLIVFALAPYAWMVVTSLKPDTEIALRPVTYWPHSLTFDHYRNLLARTTFAGNLLNSLVVAVGAQAGVSKGRTASASPSQTQTKPPDSCTG